MEERSSENLNLWVGDGLPTLEPWGSEEVEGPESIVRLQLVAAASREVGRFVRVVYKEKKGDMNEERSRQRTWTNWENIAERHRL